MEPILTIAYRHPKKEGMFLFLRQDFDVKKLPIELSSQFLPLNEVIRFEMTADKKLARAPSQQVWQALNEHGYYLQMPPSDLSSLYQAEENWIAEHEKQASQAS